MKSVVVLALIAAVSCYGGILDYTDQTSGGWDEASCQEGSKQSPIDVRNTSDAREFADGEFAFDQYENVELTAQAVNNALKWTFKNQSLDIPVPMSNGQMTTMAQLHFHWSDADDTGSEHALNGERFAAEMHLVTSYFDNAGGETQFVVFNRFFQVVSDAEMKEKEMALNRKMDAMFSKNVTNWDEGAPLSLNMSMLYGNVKEFLTYNGSLTTPECDEAVQWIIIPEPLPISQTQMENMRSYYQSNNVTEGLVGNNVRDIQSTNRRDIFCYQYSAEHHEKEEDAKEHLDCEAGQGIMYHVEQEHWECGECARGQFGWLNECVACPPGKSTVNMGASYDQCIPSRYIKCEIHMDDKDDSSIGGKKENETHSDSGMFCERDFCPCTTYEECNYNNGFCEEMSYGSAGGVTVSAFLVTACLAYIGF